MLGNLTGWHLLAVLAVIILLFGAAKLPSLAKSMGQSARLFKGEMRAMKDESNSTSQAPTVPIPESAGFTPTNDSGAEAPPK